MMKGWMNVDMDGEWVNGRQDGRMNECEYG